MEGALSREGSQGLTLLSEERISQALLEDTTRAPDLIMRVTEFGAEQRYRLMVLSAAILRLVIPMLSNTRTASFSARLRDAVYSNAASVVHGVLISGLERASLPLQFCYMNEILEARAERVGAAQTSGDAMAIAATGCG